MRPFLLAASFTVAASLLNVSVGFAQASPPRYVVTDIGDLGGSGETLAVAINSSGQVVGRSFLPGPSPDGVCDAMSAFLFENGVMRELPSLPGTRASASGFAGINDQGDVVGINHVYVEDPGVTGGCHEGFRPIQKPVFVSGGVAHDLSAPDPWYAGVAHGVNAGGQVVGWSWTTDSQGRRTYHAYLSEIAESGERVRTDLHNLEADWSIATDINDHGLVVGYFQAGGAWYGFRWSSGQMTRLPALGANTFNGAQKVNAAGDIAGYSGPSSSEIRPVLFPASGSVIDLGSLGGTQGVATAVNDKGSVVGYSSTTGDQSRHAFLHRAGRMWDLNDLVPPGSGWELQSALDINNAGRIVGYGCKDSQYDPSGYCVGADGARTYRRSFLLTPVASIPDLGDLIRSFELRQGLEASLLAKLAVAQSRVDAGQTKAACNVLGAFAREVEAQSGKGLTESQAVSILETLALIRADLGCA